MATNSIQPKVSDLTNPAIENRRRDLQQEINKNTELNKTNNRQTAIQNATQQEQKQRETSQIRQIDNTQQQQKQRFDATAQATQDKRRAQERKNPSAGDMVNVIA